jgi:hypothetical protein
MIGKMDLCSVLTCSVNVSLFLDCIFCYEIFALLYFIWPFFNLVAEIRRNKQFFLEIGLTTKRTTIDEQLPHNIYAAFSLQRC